MLSDLVALLNQHHPMSVRREPLPVLEQEGAALEEEQGQAGEDSEVLEHQDTEPASSETIGHSFQKHCNSPAVCI